MKCPKCKGEMEKGLMIDHTQGGRVKSYWGTQLRWFGLKVDNQKEVTTYRCKTCGFLESYAK